MSTKECNRRKQADQTEKDSIPYINNLHLQLNKNIHVFKEQFIAEFMKFML